MRSEPEIREALTKRLKTPFAQIAPGLDREMEVAWKEVDRLRDEMERLQRFAADIRTALRPYDGTCYLDMEGRSTGDVVREVIEAVEALDGRESDRG